MATPPCTTLKSPLGTPAWVKISANLTTEMGVKGEGLKTIALPKGQRQGGVNTQTASGEIKTTDKKSPYTTNLSLQNRKAPPREKEIVLSEPSAINEWGKLHVPARKGWEYGDTGPALQTFPVSHSFLL